MTDDKIWICCPPKDGTPKPITAKAIERCRMCSCRIWVAASTIEIILLQPNRAWPVCAKCFLEEVKTRPPRERFEFHTTPLQDDEVSQVTGTTATDALKAFGLDVKRYNPKEIP